MNQPSHSIGQEVPPPELNTGQVLKGTAASPGLGIGMAFVHAGEDLWVEARDIPPHQIEAELDRFKSAISVAQAEVLQTQAQAKDRLGGTESQIFDAHRMMLADPQVLAETEIHIRSEGRNAEYAYFVTLRRVIDVLSSLGDDALMKDRAVDAQDILARVVRLLAGDDQRPAVHAMRPGTVVAAHTLTPSDTAEMRPDRVVAFVTETGGTTSHAAIVARALEIPAVVGCDRATVAITPGDTVVVDGYLGTVYVGPDEPVLEWFRHKKAAALGARGSRRGRRPRAITTDDIRIGMELNIELPAEIARARKSGADGIGLFRTEFLFLSRHDLPDEEEQYRVYRDMVEAFGERPVTIRTLDAGGDKLARSFPAEPEANPFLGWRAIRISLAHTDIFRQQLRAVLRAANDGNVHLMFPMITSCQEFSEAKAQVELARQELRERGINVPENIPIGAMIETPAAALVSDRLARDADFFSVGTNDLVQYTLAADRNNERVSDIFDHFHPAVLALIARTTDSAQKAQIPVALCGEMAHDLDATALLVGLGISRLSMDVGSLDTVRHQIRAISKTDANRLAAEALEQPSAADVRALLAASTLTPNLQT